MPNRLSEIADKHKQGKPVSFLARLRADASGNTLAMVAAALLPLTAAVGGGVDMSRLYLVKTRLQQACDAGALTGRKVMGAGSWDNDAFAARTAATRMFNANFGEGSYGVEKAVDLVYDEAGGQVTGTASVDVDLTLMRVFGETEKTITVECDAEMRIPNTDVMFVLDTTGSMDNPDASGTGTKMQGMRRAVRCFYEALAKKDTVADCDVDPAGANSSSVQLRFGFVPYATQVNVGKLLPQNAIADEWKYQSREAVTSLQQVAVGWDDGVAYLYATTNVWTQSSWPSWSTHQTINNSSSNACSAATPAAFDVFSNDEGFPYGFSEVTPDNGSGSRVVHWYTDEPGSRTEYQFSYSSGTRRCTIQKRSRNLKKKREYRRVDRAQYELQMLFDHYDYKPIVHDISGLKKDDGTWNASVMLPVGVKGADTAVTWDGCIEERQTVRTTNFTPMPSGALDLNMDMLPDPDAPETLFGPTLPNAVWGRTQGGSSTIATVSTSASLARNLSYACPMEARRLQTWTDVDEFDGYVGGLDASGATYHDIGLIWGARFMSPDGIFADDNRTAANGGQIARHMIFMTDGDTNATVPQYTPYGIEWWDRRRTAAGAAPSKAQLDEQVNLRFLAMCQAVRNKNITLWVISYGTDVSSGAVNNLRNCASPGRFFNAADSDTLNANFRQIADEISQLRLTS